MTPGEGFFQGDDEDRAIAAQIVSGQKELFRLLIKKYERPVFGMGMSFFHNSEDASDFTQDVLLKTFRNLSRFEGRSRFSTWLYKIAYNTAINSVTRKKDYHSLVKEEIIPDIDTPERNLLKKLAQDAILEAITGLPERFRVCIDLFFFYDRSYQEIEAITGYPINTIKSHVFRAKKILREKLAGYEGSVEGGII
ncbi:MAG: sigma-70 family RNA polymerase sigma factor [Treponema sp.]|jgi:RNA polymerase sigma-70 factor (ECF subfamily)|nr:sigma-70 family RNA polymerase sigma factor [Treponema sp.]